MTTVLTKILQNDGLLLLTPLSIPLVLILYIVVNEKSSIPILSTIVQHQQPHGSSGSDNSSNVGIQLIAYIVMSFFGFWLTSRLVPTIKEYTLRKNIAGKDLGKRGTATADIPIPEALGIVPGAVFLVCLIICLVGYATIHNNNNNNNDNASDTTDNKLLDVNSALLSICFMLFLGFTDDVLDWPWRYKLILPTVASLPLLCCYNGSTTIVVPKQLRSWLVTGTDTTIITWFGTILENLYIIQIDRYAAGALIDLGFIYLLYMSMLAVFCTNAINIFAGINGLEAGQSYIIGIAILIHNLIEIIIYQNKLDTATGTDDTYAQRMINNHLFSIMILCSFVSCCLGLLRYNWYPAKVFVGDTFCYFAGMTFAVVGILGHFSKTLLLFFIPQVINFLWSTPQLFHYVPCPRHRLPSFRATTGLMYPSTFPCEAHQYKLLKTNPTDTEGINMTVLNLCLRICGPMSERNLCISLLAFQIVCCGFGFFCRYYLSKFFFDD